MLHGMAQTAHSWDFAALAFCDRYRVIALDQRGHGDSDWAPDGDYTLDAYQRDLQSAVEALRLRDMVLMGLSMGGRNAFTYAAGHPERVRALVVVDSAPVLMRSGAETIRRFVRHMDEMDSFEDFVARVRKFNPRRSEEQIRGSLAHNLKQLPSGRWTWKYDKALRSPGVRPSAGPELVDRLWGYVERVHCPTLLVRGAHSSVLSQETAEEMVSRLKDGRLAVVADAGHLAPGDNPAGFHRAVEVFLGEVGLTAP
jgi:pimeloyl-ACP methyl ester carboxylesterase